MIESKHTYKEISVRGISYKLMTYTRSLELCAKMNYETENLDFIDTIPKGEVLYDLGACEGRFSIYACKKGVKVISFEPEEKNFHVFSQNLMLNEIGKDQILPFKAGVGAQDGEANMQIGQPWEGGHQKIVTHGEIRNDLSFDFVENQKIKIMALDSFIDAYKYPIPNYLKVDIDGSEIPFLQGAERTLKNKLLKGIIFELSTVDSNFDIILNFLKKQGFIEISRFQIPNEPNLYNIIFKRTL